MHRITESTILHIKQLALHLHTFSIQYATRVILMELGLNEMNGGFEYTKLAILLFNKDPEQMITKGLYPAVARQSGRGASSFAVERSIRSAISRAWRDRDAVWSMYFPSDKCPTNGEFITHIAGIIRLLEECCAELNGHSEKEVVPIEK